MIMYYLLAGKHPLFVPNDTKDTFFRKLQNPNYKFPVCFSELAKDFFMRLCNPNTEIRYNASTALSHPWITRNFESKIPLTIYEEHIQDQNKTELVNVFKSLFFVSYTKLTHDVITTRKALKKIALELKKQFTLDAHKKIDLITKRPKSRLMTGKQILVPKKQQSTSKLAIKHRVFSPNPPLFIRKPLATPSVNILEKYTNANKKPYLRDRITPNIQSTIHLHDVTNNSRFICKTLDTSDVNNFIKIPRGSINVKNYALNEPKTHKHKENAKTNQRKKDYNLLGQNVRPSTVMMLGNGKNRSRANLMFREKFINSNLDIH